MKAPNDALKLIEKTFARDRSCVWVNAEQKRCYSFWVPWRLILPLGVAVNPKGRIIEICGPESSGKTNCCLHAVAQAQKEGIAAFIDAGACFWIHLYGSSVNINIGQPLSQPDSGEQGLELLVTIDFWCGWRWLSTLRVLLACGNRWRYRVG